MKFTRYDVDQVVRSDVACEILSEHSKMVSLGGDATAGGEKWTMLLYHIWYLIIRDNKNELFYELHLFFVVGQCNLDTFKKIKNESWKKWDKHVLISIQNDSFRYWNLMVSTKTIDYKMVNTKTIEWEMVIVLTISFK